MEWDMFLLFVRGSLELSQVIPSEPVLAGRNIAIITADRIVHILP